MGRSHLSSRETRKMKCHPLIAVGVMLGFAAFCQASFITPGFRGTSNSFGGSTGGHAVLGGFGGASSGFGGHSSSGFRGTSGGFSSGHGGGQRQTVVTIQKAPLVAAAKDTVVTGIYSNNQGGFRGNQAEFNNNQAGFRNNQAGFNSNQAGFYNNQDAFNSHQAGFHSNQGGFNSNQVGFNNQQGGFQSNQFIRHQPGLRSASSNYQGSTSGNLIQPLQNVGSSRGY